MSDDLRPLTARSVLLSTLLGLDPPVLPAHRLVATASLFGIGEGAARVALSRMTAAGEVVAEDGRYRLGGRFLARRERQASGRRPPTRAWGGGWHVFVVEPGRRPAGERAALRSAMRDARFAAWREGVWTRPDNIDRPSSTPSAGAWLSARPDEPPRLWDLDGWAATANRLVRRLRQLDRDDLAAGFMLSAAVLRHLAADPLLPPALLPRRWPGDELRTVYDRWDRAYRAQLADWHRGYSASRPAATRR